MPNILKYLPKLKKIDCAGMRADQVLSNWSIHDGGFGPGLNIDQIGFMDLEKARIIVRHLDRRYTQTSWTFGERTKIWVDKIKTVLEIEDVRSNEKEPDVGLAQTRKRRKRNNR